MRRVFTVATLLMFIVALGALAGCSNSTSDPGIITASTFEVTPDGGTFDSGQGVKLLVPLGAIAQAITVKISVEENAETGDYDALSKVFRFEPAGTEFLRPVTVQMDYTIEDSSGLVAQFMWTDKEKESVFKAIDGASFEDGVAEAKIEHFSLGFIGVYNPEPIDGDEDGDVDEDGDIDEDGDVVDGDEDGDVVDGDEDGDDDGDADGDEDGDEPEPTPISNPTVIIDSVELGGGFDFNGDDTIDNAVAGLATEAAILNSAFEAMLNSGDFALLLYFDDLTELPAPGSSGTVSVNGVYGVDSDDNPDDNFSGETFTIDPLTFDADDAYRVRFENVGIETALDGTTRISFTVDPLELTIERDANDTVYNITIRHFTFEAVLAEDDVAAGFLTLPDGVFGGVVPFALIETYGDDVKEALGINMDLTALAPYVDIDLNDDDTISHETTNNPDGISIGAMLTAVQAILQTEQSQQ